MYTVLGCLVASVGLLWWWRNPASVASRIFASALIAVGVASTLLVHPALGERDQLRHDVSTFCADSAADLTMLHREWTTPPLSLSWEQRISRWNAIENNLRHAARLCFSSSRESCAMTLGWSDPDDVVKAEFARVAEALRTQTWCPPRPVTNTLPTPAH